MNKRYHVHLYPVVRVKVEGVEATSPVEAVEKALAEGPDLYDLFRRDGPPVTEYAEEVPMALVDVEGDADHEHSRYFDYRDGQWLPSESEHGGYCRWVSQAEAQRLAAAGNLLEACRDVLLLAGDGDLADNGEYSGAAITDRVRSAVARAEGTNLSAAGRLARSAPTLLSACRTALNHLEGDRPGLVSDVAEILRLAIAEAHHDNPAATPDLEPSDRPAPDRPTP
jgi:hypothetical protein